MFLFVEDGGGVWREALLLRPKYLVWLAGREKDFIVVLTRHQLMMISLY